jgi:hypothetical protein
MTDDEFSAEKPRAPKGASERPDDPVHTALGKGTRAQLDPSVQAHIGKQLREVYDSVVRQPIPDRFLDLLKQIDRGTLQGDEDD